MAVRTIATELTLGGEKQFNDQMKAVNSNLKTLKSDMAAVSSEFRKNENSVEALRAKQKILQDQYRQQQEVVGALTKRLEHVKEVYGEDSAQADKLKQQLNAATVAMNKAKDAADENAEAIEQQTSAFNKLRSAASTAKEVLSTVASGAGKSFSAIAKAAAGLTAVGTAAVGGLAAIGAAGLKTLTGFATDAATRSKDAYDKANELANQAEQAFLQGNEAAGMEYLRQANELIDSIDADYLQLGLSLDKLNTASTGAKDALGKILLPALKDLSDEGAALLGSFAADMDAAAGDTEKMGEIMAEYLRRGIALLREQIPEFGQIAVDLLEGLGAGLEENLPQMLDDILAILDYILETIEDHADELGGAASTIISTLLMFLIEHAPDLLDAGIDLIGAIGRGLLDNLPQLIEQIPVLVSRLLDSLIENAPQMLAGGAELILQILTGLAQALPELLAEVFSLPGKLAQAFQEADIDWSVLGHNIVAGIWNGFVNTWNTVKGWIKNAVSGLSGEVQAEEEIHSPSRKWARKIGAPMAQGVGVGFEDAMRSVSRDMQRSIDGAMPEADSMRFNASFSGSGAAAAGGSVTNMGGIRIIINGYNVRDDEELAEILSYKLQQLLERKEA